MFTIADTNIAYSYQISKACDGARAPGEPAIRQDNACFRLKAGALRWGGMLLHALRQLRLFKHAGGAQPDLLAHDGCQALTQIRYNYTYAISPYGNVFQTRVTEFKPNGDEEDACISVVPTTSLDAVFAPVRPCMRTTSLVHPPRQFRLYTDTESFTEHTRLAS